MRIFYLHKKADESWRIILLVKNFSAQWLEIEEENQTKIN